MASSSRARLGWARSTWFKVVAVTAAGAALVTGAVAANGFDVAQTTVHDSTVWALKGAGDRYARLNLDLGELETVKSVTSPSNLVQTASHVLLYAQNDAKVASVSLSRPPDLVGNADDFADTPDGTATVASSGDYIGYLTTSGHVSASTVSRGGKAEATPVQPRPSASPRPTASGAAAAVDYSADAIAVGTDGVLYAYSHASGSVLRYDIRADRVVGEDRLPGGPSKAKPTLTVVGDSWALLSPDGAQLWIDGVPGPIDTGLDDTAVLQQSSTTQNVVVVADQTRLRAFSLADGRATALEDLTAPAVPAAPAWQGRRLYGAWLAPGDGPGTLWSGKATLDGAPTGGPRPLDYGDVDGGMQTDPEPVFRGNGSALVLNDAQSGWIWTVPDGALVPSSQSWDVAAQQHSQTDEQADAIAPVSDPRKPVAVDDAFGVRAGSLVSLPVMLNDYDANEDVLSIIPSSVTGLDPAFGEARIADGGQSVTVQVKPGAPTTATFRYAVTDGTTANGLNSAPATVTLTVQPDSVNRAPVWCADGGGLKGCLARWPDDLSVAPGGTLTTPLLRGWIDPDGDPIFAASVVDQSPGGQASVTPSGTLVYQQDPTVPAPAERVSLVVTISDVHGATAQRTLVVAVNQDSTMQVDPFGLMTAAGVPLTVDPSSHITGALGTPTITSATTATPGDANVTVDSSGATFGFVADKAGSYPVTMTVSDSHTTVTTTVRVTVVGSDVPLLSTTPVTVFVRPQTDTSVDVFQAVQNPTGAVLLLSDAVPNPAAGASLDVDAVGQSQLRVRGTTADEQPGLIGTVGYTVSDGTGSPQLTVHGVATVYLLPQSQPARPIALDDSVTVRAGSQVDVPVLANDVGPDGNLVVLDPEHVTVAAGDGLAFASGQVVRFLAPQTAGVVRIGYTVYTAGRPDLTAQATVIANVLPLGGNRAPQPVTLTGRVVAGASVRIPFSGFGIDPDGDAVSLDRITQQPQDGSAQISADGSAIVYTSVAGTEGPEQFTYRVRDAQGDTAAALVRVGVLNAQSDPAPVTFSDYVQVQAGAGNKVVVQPAANDLDPAGGKLTLGDVVPNAVPKTPAYDELAAHLTARTADRVTISAPDQPGATMTYTYTVTNTAGDSGTGLIVVKVVGQPVPDYPVVTDTVVSAQTRPQLAHGIDVVGGKVSWGSGDVGSLKLSLWGDAPRGVRASGTTIAVQSPPAGGMLVPFQLSGVDFSGRPVTTYGFLRIPAVQDVILALRDDAGPQRVTEGQSVTFDMSELVTVPDGQTLLVRAGGVKASGLRKGSSCVASGTRVTYTAGPDAPWADACRVPVKVADQQDYTELSVPIEVTALDPEPSLRPASLSVSPGSPAASYALTQMATWPRHDSLAALDFSVAYTGTLFSIVQRGQTLQITAHDDARPGLEESLEVGIPGHPAAGTARITLKVGPAPSALPHGGLTALECSEADGSSCSATVIGLPGEVNAYPSTPLVLVSVPAAVAGCTGVGFRVTDARTITATWAGGAPGGACTVPFQVADAQGRRSAAGSGDGSVVFSLQGFPAAPAAVTQTGYGNGKVTLAVSPGDAGSAFPALGGFHVYQGGSQVATCTAAGVCPDITGMQNGQKQTFTVRSFNSVGESQGQASTVAWSYAAPTVGAVDAESVYLSGRTTASVGWFTLTIDNNDSSATRYQVAVGNGSPTLVAASHGAVTTMQLSAQPARPTLVTVTPLSRFDPPPGQPSSARSATTRVTTAGTPSVAWSGTPTFTTTDDSLAFTGHPDVDRNGGTDGGQIVYVAVAHGDPGCVFNAADSDPISVGNGVTSSSQTISGLEQFTSYDVYACFTNGFGIAQQRLNSAPVTVWDKPAAPRGWTYSITWNGNGLPDYEYRGTQPSSTEQPPSDYVTTFNGRTDYSYPDRHGTAPDISVAYCDSASQRLCTDSAPVTASGAPFQMTVTSVTALCTRTGSDELIGMAMNQDNGVAQAGGVIVPLAFRYHTPGGLLGVGGGWSASRQINPNNASTRVIPPGSDRVEITAYRIAFSNRAFDGLERDNVHIAPDSCQIPAAPPSDEPTPPSDSPSPSPDEPSTDPSSPTTDPSDSPSPGGDAGQSTGTGGDGSGGSSGGDTGGDAPPGG